MAYMHIYNGDGAVTAGNTDGYQVSEGDRSNPIVFGPLDASYNQESYVQGLGIRCEAGYVTGTTTTITPAGTNAAKVALSADGTNWGNYGAVLTLPSGIGDTNTMFYAKAKATSDENPVSDVSITLAVSCDIIYVA